jgi:two-component system LytT family sensor kinase
MKPPADRRLDAQGSGIDLPAPARPRYGLRWPHVFVVATILGTISSVLAWQFTLTLGRPTTPWRTLVILNGTYWYVWAIFTPAIVWLSQHFRFERKGLVRAVLIHLPSAALFSLAHIAAMATAHWWLAASEGKAFSWPLEFKRSALLHVDWEMMTYWAIAGLSHAVLYYRESRDRAIRSSQLETRLIAAQMAALRQQLQPHFLFNTLHAISALMHRDVDAADRTLMKLSDLLRMTLENVGRQEIPLHAELDFLSKYLDIEQTRFADRLVVRFDVEPETLDTLVPTLLLQPLVENAIKHGVSKKNGPGHVDIRARCATTASGCRKRRWTRCRRGLASRPRGHGCSTSSAPTTGSNSTGCRKASRSWSLCRGGRNTAPSRRTKARRTPPSIGASRAPSARWARQGRAPEHPAGCRP